MIFFSTCSAKSSVSPSVTGGGFLSPHHSFHNDDLGAELLVNGKDVDQTQGEDHEVYGQDGPPCLVGVTDHPAKSNQTTRHPSISTPRSHPVIHSFTQQKTQRRHKDDLLFPVIQSHFMLLTCTKPPRQRVRWQPCRTCSSCPPRRV